MSQGSWQREQMGAGCKQQSQPGRNSACVNNCGFFGNETTLNMCPSCYRTYLSSQASAGPQSHPAGTSPIVSPDTPPEATASESHLNETADMIPAEDAGAEGLVPPEETDSCLLERACHADSSASLGSARARFPRVQSASESARDTQASALGDASLGFGTLPGKQDSLTLKPDVSPDSLVRTNASRTLDVDMRHNPVFLPPSSDATSAPSRPAAAAAVPPRTPVSASGPNLNRCDLCRKKVGLTGFKCRCNKLFCGSHRYSDKHSCTFDYKAAAREAIAKANPVVKADKVVRF